jgi:hypothetical protein
LLIVASSRVEEAEPEKLTAESGSWGKIGDESEVDLFVKVLAAGGPPGLHCYLIL